MKALVVFLLLCSLVSCQRDFTIKTNANVTQLVVEGYINNEDPEYNYVLLTKSQDFFSTDTAGLIVTDAKVTVTAGDLGETNGGISWDTANRVSLIEQPFGGISDAVSRGVYSDPRLKTDPGHALRGEPGRFYRLDIDYEGKQYSSVTSMPGVIPIDSITTGYYFTDMADSNISKARITINYQDPDTTGNSELFFRRSSENRKSFGWGGLKTNARLNNDDALINGQYVRLTVQYSFGLGDTVVMQMASVDRAVYNFWNSYGEALSNDGPFATPIVLKTNITGENVTGCFSGFSTSSIKARVE